MRIAVIVLSSLMSCAALAQDWPSARRGYEATALGSDRFEHSFSRWGDAILIEDVMVNGQGPFRFLLDTGAEGAGRLDRSVVEALGIPQLGESEGVGLLGQALEMTVHRLDSLAIGSLRFEGVEMTSRDYSGIAGPGLRPIHGILGYHLFNEYLLTIDYPSRRIEVERGELPPSDGTSILDIGSDDEDPEVGVTIGGHSALALLDTGAMNHLAVPDSFATGLSFVEEPVVRGRQNGAEVRVGTLDGALRIGGFEFPGVQTFIAAPLVQPVIGVRVLSELSMTFDQKNARVRLGRPPARPSFGLVLAWRGPGPWQFQGAREGSVAERAGLLETDRLISINGRPFEEIDREDMFRMLDGSELILAVERGGAPIEVRLTPQ